MTLFITSSPCVDGADRAILNPDNHFLDLLRHSLPQTPRCLFICSNPDDHRGTCEFGSHMLIAFSEAGIAFESYNVLDGSNARDAARLINDSDFIILAGGHVPTQNAFFHKIKLDTLLKNYKGVIMGVSAGSMNCAATVYVQPEEPGETIDPNYRRFAPGLGLTNANVCPHYQKVKDAILDGKRLFEDVTYADSKGRTFFALPDGSFILNKDGKEYLFGEAYRIRNGILEQICVKGQSVELKYFY